MRVPCVAEIVTFSSPVGTDVIGSSLTQPLAVAKSETFNVLAKYKELNSPNLVSLLKPLGLVLIMTLQKKNVMNLLGFL